MGCEGCMTGGEIPPHRCLFHTYTYQYHLMEFSVMLISAKENSPIIFSSSRSHCLLSSSTSHGWRGSGPRHGSGSPRCLFPISLVRAYGITASILSMKMTKTQVRPAAAFLYFVFLIYVVRYNTGKGRALHGHWVAQRRDPDALPPRNLFEAVMNALSLYLRVCT